VDDDNVGHSHEGGDSCRHFGADRRAVGLQLELTFQKPAAIKWNLFVNAQLVNPTLRSICSARSDPAAPQARTARLMDRTLSISKHRPNRDAATGPGDSGRIPQRASLILHRKAPCSLLPQPGPISTPRPTLESPTPPV